ncbi:MFS transporter [Amycolatopsis ultiminotia]|uniref:MFS transporter n=1 Tax=Amycolatopsis ultiminotia TaxID=543629 RepID=A0ABP6YS99_9PSEU
MRAPLRYPAFRRLASGRTAVSLGNAVAPVALAFAVLDLTGSAVDLGIVVGARSAATVVLVLFGGVLADRLPRPVLMQGTAAAAAVSQVAIGVSVLAGLASVPLLVVLNVVNGALAAVSLPTGLAMTPQTVPSGLLRPANAVARMASNAGMVAGAPLGGLLAAFVGPGWAVTATSLAFALAAGCYHRLLAAIRPVAVGAAAADPNAPSGRPPADLRAGWREFSGRHWVWPVVLQFMVVNAVVTGCMQVLGPAVADRGVGRSGWGLVLAAETVGALVGGIVASRWQPRRALYLGVAVTFVQAVPLLVMADAPVLGLLLAAMFVTGVALEQFAIAWDVSLQQHIPADRLAKVYSYDVIGSLVAMPIGETAAGPVAAAFGVPATLHAGAALVVLATAGTLCGRAVRVLRVGSGAITP